MPPVQTFKKGFQYIKISYVVAEIYFSENRVSGGLHVFQCSHEYQVCKLYIPWYQDLFIDN